jgi:hypothetical protein
VFEEALNVRLSSGGGTRRKRGKAARLQPAGEDASSTSQLFDLTRLVVDEDVSMGAVAPEPTTPPPNGDAPVEPLLRYEWRNAAGDTLIVEAAWPTAPGVVPANENGTATVGGNGNGNGHPKRPVDLRQVTELH